ncbi:MAG: endonuclease/exonuclease/phosphatase family protein [Candidatus Neomarinimicrobiota bacterium]
MDELTSIKTVKKLSVLKKNIYPLLIGISIIIMGSSRIHSQSHLIMSYNIRYDNSLDDLNNWEIRKDKVLEIFTDYDPGIIGIQEGLINQVQYIDSSLMNYDYFGVGRDDGKSKGEFCSIFYDRNRYILNDHSTFWLSETPDHVSVGWDAALERICTYGLFKDTEYGDSFWVFNTHFDHMGLVAREKSSELILDKIDKVNHENLPIILMGDFNSMPKSQPIKKVKSKLFDGLDISLKELNGPIGTYNAFNTDLPIEKRIDYIFVNDFKVDVYTHINDRLNDNRHISDHLPVLIKVQ